MVVSNEPVNDAMPFNSFFISNQFFPASRVIFRSIVKATACNHFYPHIQTLFLTLILPVYFKLLVNEHRFYDKWSGKQTNICCIKSIQFFHFFQFKHFNYTILLPPTRTSHLFCLSRSAFLYRSNTMHISMTKKIFAVADTESQFECIKNWQLFVHIFPYY